MDDSDGVKFAAAAGANVIRTPGIYRLAKERGFVRAVRPKLDNLRKAGFWLRDEHYRMILERHWRVAQSQFVPDHDPTCSRSPGLRPHLPSLSPRSRSGNSRPMPAACRLQTTASPAPPPAPRPPLLGDAALPMGSLDRPGVRCLLFTGGLCSPVLHRHRRNEVKSPSFPAFTNPSDLVR